MSQLEEINDLNFHHQVGASSGRLLLVFGATWCAPCRQLVPLLEEWVEGSDSGTRVGKLDIEESPLTAQEFKIRGAPTLVMLQDGVEISRVLGAPGKKKLAELLG